MRSFTFTTFYYHIVLPLEVQQFLVNLLNRTSIVLSMPQHMGFYHAIN